MGNGEWGIGTLRGPTTRGAAGIGRLTIHDAAGIGRSMIHDAAGIVRGSMRDAAGIGRLADHGAAGIGGRGAACRGWAEAPPLMNRPTDRSTCGRL